MIALWINTFVSVSTDVLPNNRVCVKKESLHLIFCNQCYLKCSRGYVRYHQIQKGGEESEKLTQYSKYKYEVDLNNSGKYT